MDLNKLKSFYFYWLMMDLFSWNHIICIDSILKKVDVIIILKFYFTQLLFIIYYMKTTTDSDMKQIFIEAMWWDIKNDKPHNVFIEGDKSTRLNLGWFIKKE